MSRPSKGSSGTSRRARAVRTRPCRPSTCSPTWTRSQRYRRLPSSSAWRRLVDALPGRPRRGPLQRERSPVTLNPPKGSDPFRGCYRRATSWLCPLDRRLARGMRPPLRWRSASRPSRYASTMSTASARTRLPYSSAVWLRATFEDHELPGEMIEGGVELVDDSPARRGHSSGNFSIRHAKYRQSQRRWSCCSRRRMSK